MPPCRITLSRHPARRVRRVLAALGGLAMAGIALGGHADVAAPATERPSRALAAQSPSTASDAPAARRAAQSRVARGTGRRGRAASTPTAAPTTTTTAAPAPRAHPHPLIAEALDLISYPYEVTGFALEVEPSRAGVRGVTKIAEKRIEMYPRPGEGPADVARVLAHEIGHAVDAAFLDDAERAEYREMRGIPGGTSWWPCSACSDFATGTGDFAEVFNYWLLGREFASEVAPLPTAEQLAWFERFLHRATPPSSTGLGGAPAGAFGPGSANT